MLKSKIFTLCLLSLCLWGCSETGSSSSTAPDDKKAGASQPKPDSEGAKKDNKGDAQ
jgi:hypothetical protein